MAKVIDASLGGAAPTQKLEVQHALEEIDSTLSSDVSCSAAKVKAKSHTNPVGSLLAILVAVSVCLLAADVFTYGDKDWYGEALAFLQQHTSWTSYSTELVLVLVAAILMTSRWRSRPCTQTAHKCRAFKAAAPSSPLKRPSSDATKQHARDQGIRSSQPLEWRAAAVHSRSDTAASSAGSSARWKCKQDMEVAARTGDVKKASELLRKFEELGGEPQAVYYNWLILACAKRGELGAAEKWLGRMQQKGIQVPPCSYNTLLGAFAKADMPDAVEQWLQKMVDAGVQRNAISYGSAIYAHARTGNVARAEALFQEMSAAGIQADAVCYNSLIHACGVSGATAEAKRWLDEMEAKGMKTCVTTFTAIIGACAKRGDIDYAEFWFARMVEKGVVPNIITFSSMIDACAKANSLARAEVWHDRMLEHGVTADPHSFTAVINACARQGGAHCAGAAEQWLERAEQAGMAKDIVYSAAIDACGKAGDAEKALRVFNRMKAAGYKASVIAYSALARSFALRGDWIKVESLAQSLAADGLKANDYFVYAQLLAYAVARPREAQRAEACFRLAMKDGVKANDHLIGVLARAVGRPQCIELMREGVLENVPYAAKGSSREGGSRDAFDRAAAAKGGQHGRKGW